MATAAWCWRQWFTPRRWSEALRALRRAPKHPFDRAHRVDTGGLIYADGLSTGHEHDIHSSGYYATAPSLFRGSMRHWSATLEALSFRICDYAFVDIGCGKGRVVLLASEYAFREVVGVELNPQLASVASRNLNWWMRRMRTCRNVRIAHGDALSFPLPDGPVVLFFFNSFEEEMVRMWLDSLVEASATRSAPIDLIYMHPEHHKLFIETPGVKTLARIDLPLSPEDASSDAFGVSFDPCTIYRLLN
jgi:SAM-dependent methyltransferase